MTPSKPPKTPPKPRYVRWRARNPEIYRKRQRDYMRKRRAKLKAIDRSSPCEQPRRAALRQGQNVPARGLRI